MSSLLYIDDYRITSYQDEKVEEFSTVLTGKLDFLVPFASFYDLLRETFIGLFCQLTADYSLVPMGAVSQIQWLFIF